MEMRLLDLEQVDPEERQVFGGKACGLAALLRAGARVPRGFAVSATFLPTAGWNAAARAELMARSQDLLARGALAVRSSALSEDSATKSFAGLFETVLGVKDGGSLLAAVDRCVASGSSLRVRTYAETDAPLPVGVVVQSEVVPRASGVCFTADPSGRDRAVIVEAVPGMGEALVSGRAQPEAWRLYRSGLGGWEARREGRAEVTVLEDGHASRVAEAATALAGRFGHPLDLEWAIGDDGALWWLQARPITAAAPLRDFNVERYFDGVDDGPVSVWSNWNVREVVPEVFLPLNWSLWRQAVIPSVVEPLFGVARSSRLFLHAVPTDLVHGRLYWNMNALLAAPLYGKLFPRLLHRLDARAGATMKELMRKGILRPRRLPGSALPRTLGVLLAGARSTVGLLRGLAPRRVLRALEQCGQGIARRPEISSLGSDELLAEMQLLDAPVCDPFRKGQQATALGFLLYVVGERTFRRYPEAHRLLTAGIPGNPTTLISVGIDDLADAAREVAGVFREVLAGPELLQRLESEPAGRAWLLKLREFLDRFGHRCPSEFDIGTPRWKEDPAMILGLVRSRLEQGGESVRERLARLWEERRRAVDRAVQAAPLWQRGFLRPLARLVALYMPLREAPKHYAMVVIERMRLAALELGRRLAERGFITAREDVFFLEWSEVRALARGERLEEEARALVERRRERWAHHCSERTPDFVRSDGVPLEEMGRSRETEGVYSGTSVSSGCAVGSVRVLTEPDPLALAPGEVLVAAFADPGWTPLFPRASAIVMEVGGAMCHAAVVARELGIPAVFGVQGAARLLRTGQRVRVDGGRGIVTLAEDDGA